MQDLERTIERRFPQWFQGQRARLARSLVRSLAKVSRLDQLERFQREHGHPRGFAFVDPALAWLDCRWLFGPVSISAELALLDLAQVKPKQRERYLGHRPRIAARSQPEVRT